MLTSASFNIFRKDDLLKKHIHERGQTVIPREHFDEHDGSADVLSWDVPISVVSGASGGRPLHFTVRFLFPPPTVLVHIAPTFERARETGVAMTLAGLATAVAAATVAPRATTWVPKRFLFLETAGSPTNTGRAMGGGC
jgi:hypothetical protein